MTTEKKNVKSKLQRIMYRDLMNYKEKTGMDEKTFEAKEKEMEQKVNEIFDFFNFMSKSGIIKRGEYICTLSPDFDQDFSKEDETTAERLKIFFENMRDSVYKIKVLSNYVSNKFDGNYETNTFIIEKTTRLDNNKKEISSIMFDTMDEVTTFMNFVSERVYFVPRISPERVSKLINQVSNIEKELKYIYNVIKD